jgi:drug/metabolite transporter (DMT)-like permease
MRGIILALLAAFLFGVSTPLAKLLLPHTSPMLMAGLLYLGSGCGLGLYRLSRLFRRADVSKEAPLSRKDMPWLIGAFLFGGVVAPVLLLFGLQRTAASSASLLLNFEAVFTALLAWFVFKENFDRRIAAGMALIVAGGLCLSWIGRPGLEVTMGSAAILGACLAWAIDNNLTRKVSAGDPVQIAMLKGSVAGVINTSLAVVMGDPFPSLPVSMGIGVIGFLGYGVSLTFFVLALRHVGTARTGAYFSTSPFVGAVVSILVLGERPGVGFAMGALLMAAGVWLHLRERHEHEHCHEPMEHEHLHFHDEHHQHAHAPGDPPGEPHSHFHRHDELVHSHPHYPDIHHRHAH